MHPWNLTAAQHELATTAAEFARSEIAPIAVQSDEDRCLIPEVAERFHATGVGQRFLDPDFEDFATCASLVTEELGYACAAYSSYLMLPVFFNRLVGGYLTGRERDKFLAECHDRPVVTSFAASEADAGSDMMALETRATATDGGYVLNGSKAYSTNLGIAQYVIVVARTGAPDTRGTDTMSWFLVPTNAPGLVIGPRWNTFGLRALTVSPMELNDVHVPLAYRLGEEGRGLPMMANSLSLSRTGIAALGVGIARRARDLVMDYGRKRRIYGDKLNRLQDYRFRISQMEMEIASARGLVWASCQRADSGQDPTKEASIAKLFSGQMAMSVTVAASGMLGSSGYTGQTQVEKLLRDARHVGIVEGPEPTHKELIFAHMLRHGAY